MKRITLLFIGILFIGTIFSQNRDEYLYKPLQVTFMVPPFGINGTQFAKCVNNVAINTFIGHSAGVEGVEFGGFINTESAFMEGAQFAGFANIIGGHAEGVQFAGFANIVKTHFDGFQSAGFINVAGEEMSGLQVAGFSNITKKANDGFQIAGFMNTAPKGEAAGQISGFVNVGNDINGVQIAGFGNFAQNVEGPQLSGFINAADDVDGIQVGGFINIARNVDGVQIGGFINVCDSIDGIQLGFLNVVKKNGYRRLELSANELSYLNLSFKTGSNYFYNIYTLSKLTKDMNRFAFGCGIGTKIDMNNSLSLNIEATTMQVIWVNDSRTKSFLHIDRLNMANSLKALFTIDIDNQFEWFAGPTFNVHVSNSDVNDVIKGSDYSPNWHFVKYNTNGGNNIVKMWVGFMAGIRF